jgi:hypothetical protein
MPCVLFQVLPVGEFTQICVSFDNGNFTVSLDGVDQGLVISTAPYTFAPNTHSSTTLGFKPGNFDNFYGYIDDVS